MSGTIDPIAVVNACQNLEPKYHNRQQAIENYYSQHSGVDEKTTPYEYCRREHDELLEVGGIIIRAGLAWGVITDALKESLTDTSWSLRPEPFAMSLDMLHQLENVEKAANERLLGMPPQDSAYLPREFHGDWDIETAVRACGWFVPRIRPLMDKYEALDELNRRGDWNSDDFVRICDSITAEVGSLQEVAAKLLSYVKPFQISLVPLFMCLRDLASLGPEVVACRRWSWDQIQYDLTDARMAITLHARGLSVTTGIVPIEPDENYVDDDELKANLGHVTVVRSAQSSLLMEIDAAIQRLIDKGSDGGDGEVDVALAEEDDCIVITVLREKNVGVVLKSSNESPIVCGVSKAVLSDAKYCTIKALITAGQEGLSKDQMESHCASARAVLRDLVKDPDWKRAIWLPGKFRNRYRIINGSFDPGIPPTST